MRMNLISQSKDIQTVPSPFRVSLTIRPANGIPGDYEFSTDSASLMLMLRKQTDLPSTVLQRFEGDLKSTLSAKLLAVDLRDRKSTRLNSSHLGISYAVFCLKKETHTIHHRLATGTSLMPQSLPVAVVPA